MTEGRVAPGTTKKTTTTPSTGGTTKSNISIYSSGNKNFLVVQNYCQQICFGSTESDCAVNIYTSFNGWVPTGTQKFELPGGGGDVEHGLNIITLPGTPGPNDYSRWDNSCLVLVQEPVYWVCCGSPTDRVVGYKLI